MMRSDAFSNASVFASLIRPDPPPMDAAAGSGRQNLRFAVLLLRAVSKTARPEAVMSRQEGRSVDRGVPRSSSNASQDVLTLTLRAMLESRGQTGLAPPAGG